MNRRLRPLQVLNAAGCYATPSRCHQHAWADQVYILPESTSGAISPPRSSGLRVPWHARAREGPPTFPWIQKVGGAFCNAFSDQERPWRSYLLPAGEGAPQGRMRDEMLALARKFPSSGRSGPTPQAGFPPLPAGEGEDVPPRLQLNGKTR